MNNNKCISRITSRLILFFWISVLSLVSSAQGVVNVNNRGLTPAQPVLDGNGVALVGTQVVAQIVYGRDASSMTNVLGDPMPFRAGTTTFPGTWNPGAAGLRTLNGFVEGQTVYMRVYAWDASVFSGLDQVRGYAGGYWSCREIPSAVGVSEIFTYLVQNSPQPSSIMMSNFRSFRTQSLHAWPGSYIADVLGGIWVGRIDATENSETIPVNLLNVPPVQIPESPVYSPELPPGTHGGEPVGWAVRSVTAGNPLNLAIPPQSQFGSPRTVMAGFTETVELTTEQTSAETSLVSVEGVVSNTIIRLKKPFIGRVVLQFRYPLDPQLTPGCVSAPRNLVVDLKPAGTPVRIAAVANTAPGLRLKLESGPTHVISRSFDLATWEPVGTYSVGYPMCLPQVGPSSCGIQIDLDETSRFGDFTVPIQGLLPTNGTGTVFFRLESR